MTRAETSFPHGQGSDGSLRSVFASPIWALLVGWALGCAGLAHNSLWIDEWYTMGHIRTPWADVLARIIASERRPPLQFLTYKLWGELLGSDEFVLRWLSIALVALSVALLFVLGRRLVNRPTGLLAAWLLALSPFWLLYGRMLRAYSQTMLLALAATLLLVIAVEHARRGEQGGRGWWIAYIAAATALIYTDYSGLPVLAAHGVYVLAEWWFTRRRRSFDREGEGAHRLHQSPDREGGSAHRSLTLPALTESAHRSLTLPALTDEPDRSLTPPALTDEPDRSLTPPALTEGRGSLLPWLLSMVVVGLAYLPWLPSIFTATERSVRLTDLAGGPLGFGAKLAVPLYTWASGETLYPWHPLGALAALVMGLLALWGLWKVWRRRAATGVLLLTLIALPLLFTATLLALVATDITFLNAASRTPGAAPIYVLAAAAGLVALPRRWLRGLALVCILAGTAASALNYFNGVQYLNPIYALPTRDLAAQLAAEAQPGDLVLAEPDTLLGYYYNQAPGAAAYQDVDPAANLRWIEQHGPHTVWLATFNRDSTEGTFGTAELVTALQEAGYTAGERRGYGPVESLYQAVKQRLTGRPAYDYKLVIQPYTR